MEGRSSGPVARIEGADLVIFYGAEIMGSLDGCGCMGNPKLGGFGYRMGAIRSFQQENPDVGTLLVDAGFTSRPITTGQASTSAVLRAEAGAVYRALQESGFAAVNVTVHDIAAVDGLVDSSAEGGPIREILVSANIEPASSAFRPFSPFVVREVQRSGGARAVKVAIVGISDGVVDPASGFRSTEPGAALEVQIAAARKVADVVVVLAYLPLADFVRVFDRLENRPDVVIVANSFGAGSSDGSVMGAGLEARLDGPMRVVFSWYKTQKLGVLGLRLDDSNRVESAWNDYVKLDDPIVPDPAAEAMVKRQKDAVRAAREERYRAEGVQ